MIVMVDMAADTSAKSGPGRTEMSTTTNSDPRAKSAAAARHRQSDTDEREPASAAAPTAAGKPSATIGPTGENEVVRPVREWRPGMAVDAALRHQTVTLTVPVIGRVTLPGRAHLIWYAGVGTLAVFEVIEWPIAFLMGVAKALSDSRHHEVLREFGNALEAGV
jgi:hypothetical protein